jgi:hypothetical protein
MAIPIEYVPPAVLGRGRPVIEEIPPSTSEAAVETQRLVPAAWAKLWVTFSAKLSPFI